MPPAVAEQHSFGLRVCQGGRPWGALPAAPASRARFSTSLPSEVFSSSLFIVEFSGAGLEPMLTLHKFGGVLKQLPSLCAAQFPSQSQGKELF